MAEGQGPVHPADGSAGGPRPLQDIVVDHPLLEQYRHLKALLHGPQLCHGTQVLEKIVDFLLGFQRQDGLIQTVALLLFCDPCHQKLLRWLGCLHFNTSICESKHLSAKSGPSSVRNRS